LLNQWLPAIERVTLRVLDYTASKSRRVMWAELEREWRVNKHLRREGSIMIDLRAEIKLVYPNTI
jgi:hypothetical protein